MRIVPFEIEHVASLQLQERQLHWLSRMTPDYLFRLRDHGVAYSALEDRILGCAGIVDTGFGTGLLWALVDKSAGRHFVGLTRAVRRLMALVPLRRLEATTECDFAAGCRALKLLGFENEGVMRRYGPDGSDHYRYARIA